VNEPDLMALAVEEFLPLLRPSDDGPTGERGLDFFGVAMKKDDWILLGFPAANRDPEAFRRRRHVHHRSDRPIDTRPLAWASTAAPDRIWPAWNCVVAIEEFIARYPKFELSDANAVTWAPG